MTDTARPSLAHRLAYLAPWLLVALPALVQIVLLATAIAGRISYPYDLEWMEGGMLHHAQRIRAGEGIYVPPSIEFIPYLYTPLYPSLLALFGSAFGLTYQLGRAISVLGLIGNAIVGLATARGERGQAAAPAVGTLLGLGLFAAAYPYMEGWYDLVRADSLFLFLVTAGIAGVWRWARGNDGMRGHAKVAAGGVLLALAFFCKQTAIVYVLLGGLIVLVGNWRRVPAYVLATGVIGLGGTWLLQHTTDGWFWTYTREIHAAHDFNMDRFWKSFGNILWKFPPMTIVTAIGLVAVGATWVAKRSVPARARPLFLWASAFAVSTVIGAVGWGTEFAHYNAYMPAFLHGGLAAGAAVAAIEACSRVWLGGRRGSLAMVTAIGVAAAAPLAYTCWAERWKPERFIPTARDRAAGDKLIARIRQIEGEVWMPSHPWYLTLAGKTPRVHRMGILDVTWRQTRVVHELLPSIQNQRFAALVLDDRDVHVAEVPVIKQYYRPALKLEADERPKVYTGNKRVPEAIWVPSREANPPPGARVLFDFEVAQWSGWTSSGAAWGKRPVDEMLPGQGLVVGFSGRRFATSMHGGDAAKGRITSPPFVLDGVVQMKLAGGTEPSQVRVELWVDTVIVATTSAPIPGGGTLREVRIDPGSHRGATARLVFVDESATSHLDVDDVWIVP